MFCKSKKTAAETVCSILLLQIRTAAACLTLLQKRLKSSPPSRGNPELFGEEGELPHKYSFKAI